MFNTENIYKVVYGNHQCSVPVGHANAFVLWRCKYLFRFFDPLCFMFSMLRFILTEEFICSDARFIIITVRYKSLTLSIFANVVFTN